MKLYKEKSSLEWGCDDSEPMTIEKINCGAILRIADAVEKMSKNYVQLQSDLDYETTRRRESELRNGKLFRSNAALRGIIRKLKGGAA